MDHPILIVGPGRLGTALAAALRLAGVPVRDPVGRRDGIPADAASAPLVLLCVPDARIAAVAGSIPRGPLVAHCSGALSLDALADHEGFSMHPLLSVTGNTTTFAGAGCAVSATSPRAREACLDLVWVLGMRPFEIPDEMRALYHAAASVAAGYVVTVAAFAERLMQRAGVDRAYLAPLVRSAVENWERSGAAALTGPVARGDDATIAMHRAALARYAPQDLQFWEALTSAAHDLTARLAARAEPLSPPRTADEP